MTNGGQGLKIFRTGGVTNLEEGGYFCWGGGGGGVSTPLHAMVFIIYCTFIESLPDLSLNLL